jgi:hypothetical protein
MTNSFRRLQIQIIKVLKLGRKFNHIINIWLSQNKKRVKIQILLSVILTNTQL